MIQNVLTSIGGVGMYGVFSIALFFVFFAGMLIWALCLKKPYLTSMSELPLDGESAPEKKPTSNPAPLHE